MKRAFDFTLALVGGLLSLPILLPVMLAIYLYDFRSPFYIAPRVGRKGRMFRMFKLRSMTVGADKSGVASTSADDRRITPVGAMVRRYKLDELTQLWNIVRGDMSFVGPRPQVQKDVDLYTTEERGLLEARPGITDFSSIVFSDEGDILKGKSNPDLEYNRLIRPWKSRMGLFYIQKQSLLLDLKLIALTVLSIFSRATALEEVAETLEALNADPRLVEIARRKQQLTPHPPPGAAHVFQSY